MKRAFSIPVLIFNLTILSSGCYASAAEKPIITLDIVKKSLASFNTKNKEQGHQFSVAVVDDGGNLLYAERPESVAPGMIDASIGKAKTAARYGIATKLIELEITKGRTSYLNLPSAVPIEGGIPILLKGVIVGAIGVAGSSSDIDEGAAEGVASSLTEALNSAAK